MRSGRERKINLGIKCLKMSEATKTKERDVALDYIRVLAMLMIAFCHFFQIINSLELAFWLNVGVQIFLVLSARLLCEKDFRTGKEVLRFYGTRLVRIMLPVWIYLTAICGVLYIIKQPPSLISVVVYALGGAAFIKSGVLGLGHFWYLSIILIAYLITPLLAYFSQTIKKVKNWVVVLFFTITLLLLTALFFLLGNPSYGIHLSLFIIAYYVFQRQKEDTKWAEKGIKYVCIPMLLFVAARIVCSIVSIENWEHYVLYDATFVPTCKAVLGYWLFCVAYWLFSKERFQIGKKAIAVLSAVSFEIYITHQFIELAVYEYVPYCNSGTLFGGLLMFIVSAVLIAINTLVLHYCVILLKKGFVKLKK